MTKYQVNFWYIPKPIFIPEKTGPVNGDPMEYSQIWELKSYQTTSLIINEILSRYDVIGTISIRVIETEEV